MRFVVLVSVLVAGCVAGQPTDEGSDASAPAGCTKDTDCKGDRICVDGQCAEPMHVDASLPGCGKDTDCKGDRICINGQCTEPAANDAAVAERDLSIVDSSTPDFEAPPDLYTPRDLLVFCGGVDCSFANAAGMCVNGACAMGACNPGYADCNKNSNDGCEVSTQTDPKNCGACSVACSMNHIASPTCAAARCTGQCNSGWGDCNGDKRVDGCETNLSSDIANCGMCGAVCTLANATAACDGTLGDAGIPACHIGSCSSGFADCDHVTDNGCEIDLNTDAAHCGDCSNVCPQGQSCKNGVCG